MREYKNNSDVSLFVGVSSIPDATSLFFDYVTLNSPLSFPKFIFWPDPGNLPIITQSYQNRAEFVHSNPGIRAES